MADIFNRNVSNLGGVFTADRAKLQLKGNLGVLVQRLQFTYAQTVTRLYEVGGGNIYYIGGRTQGNLSVDRVIGPQGSVCAMYAQYGDVCKAKQNIINLTLTETDCSGGGGGFWAGVAGALGLGGRSTSAFYSMKNCVITQVSVGVAAQDMIISENTTMMYSSLECS